MTDLFTGVGWSFGVTIDGLDFMEVTKVEGIKLEADVIELKTNSLLGQYSRKKLPGRMKSGTITLSRAYPATPANPSGAAFIKWIQQVFQGDMSSARHTMIITVFATAFAGFSGSPTGVGPPVAQFTAINCWPTAVDFGSFTAGDTNSITEKVTIHHEGLYETLASGSTAPGDY